MANVTSAVTSSPVKRVVIDTSNIDRCLACAGVTRLSRIVSSNSSDSSLVVHWHDTASLAEMNLRFVEQQFDKCEPTATNLHVGLGQVNYVAKDSWVVQSSPVQLSAWSVSTATQQQTNVAGQ